MKFGLQLYSVRDAAERNYEDTLRRVAEMGYCMVEPAGFFGNRVEDVAVMLRHYGLRICSTHTAFQRVDTELEKVIAEHRLLGCKDVIIPGAPQNTKEKLSYLIRTINRVQPILEDAGMRLHFHNHSSEFLPNLDGQIVFEELAKQTAVLFEVDTFWAFNAGLCVADVLERYRERICFIHLKDGFVQDFSNPESKPRGMSVGSGEVPIKSILQKARGIGAEIIVESEGLEPTGLAEVARCMDFLRTVCLQ